MAIPKLPDTVVGSMKAAYYMVSTTLRYAGAKEMHRLIPRLLSWLVIQNPVKQKHAWHAHLETIEVAQLYHAFLTDLAQRFGGQDYTLHWAYTPA